MRHQITLTVNGETEFLEVESHRTLLQVLREDLDLTGTKDGCNSGECGACTVLFDGEPVNACLVLAVEADGHEVVTIEGLTQDGALDPLQRAFINRRPGPCWTAIPGPARWKSARPLPGTCVGAPGTRGSWRQCRKQQGEGETTGENGII
jgi:carbon-monoxide dehydrogenase small subunit